MSLIADLLSNSKDIDTTLPTTALDRVVIRELNAVIDRGDLSVTADYEAKDEVQSIADYAVDFTGGTFTLSFTLASGETFTTGAIAYDADAATIESAIDSAATSAGVVGWSNGDISVSGGDLTTAPVVLTYDGNSVTGLNHGEVTLDGGSLTGGGTLGAISTTTQGQTIRRAWAALQALGVLLTSELPAQGSDPGELTLASNPGDNANYPSEATIRALATEAAIEDGNVAVETRILAAANLS